MKEVITPFITKEEIEKRVKELAKQIISEFNTDSLTLICILRGGVMFMVDLAREMDILIEMDFMEISSYGDSTQSSGVIKIVKDLAKPITGKHVLLVEDIIDTGRTLTHLKKHLYAQNPLSLKICALLDKYERREDGSCEPDYVGFKIEDVFAVGYGLDYAQKYRNLPYIGELKFVEEE